MKENLRNELKENKCLVFLFLLTLFFEILFLYNKGNVFRVIEAVLLFFVITLLLNLEKNKLKRYNGFKQFFTYLYYIMLYFSDVLLVLTTLKTNKPFSMGLIFGIPIIALILLYISLDRLLNLKKLKYIVFFYIISSFLIIWIFAYSFLFFGNNDNYLKFQENSSSGWDYLYYSTLTFYTGNLNVNPIGFKMELITLLEVYSGFIVNVIFVSWAISNAFIDKSKGKKER